MVNLYKPGAKAAKAKQITKHTASPSKPLASWSKLGYVCQKQEVRDWLDTKLRSMREAIVNARNDKGRPKMTKELQGLCAVGTNGAMKALERSACRVVVVCRDAPDVLHNHVVDAAHMRNVPVVVLPKSSTLLGKPLQIKRLSCAAFLVQQPQEHEGIQQTSADPLAMHLAAIQDQICDVMITHAVASRRDSTA